jgi:phenylpyruvate tautomerase PptA (4-oxalocrotonate tautomerase family)
LPVITVQMFRRSSEIKAKIASGITDVIVRETGVSPEGVEVIFVDLSEDSYSRGGRIVKPASSTVETDGH